MNVPPLPPSDSLPHGADTEPLPTFPLLDAGRPTSAASFSATGGGNRKRSEDALRAAALAVSNTQGEGIFRELVRYLAEVLGVDVAMIAVYTDDDRTRMRTLAASLDRKPLANFEYLLAGSPCRHVVGREFRFVPKGVHSEFPRGTLFAAKGIDSYAALPLNDAAGAPLGLVAVMDRDPLEDAELAEWMLKIFAARATAEIERLRAVAALRESEASYRAIFEASEDPIFVHDWDTGAILDVSPKAEEVYGYTAAELRHLRVGSISLNEPPYTEAEARQWLEAAKSGPPVRLEWRARHRDGRLMWHEVRLKRATIAGQRRILAFVRDITASRAAEDALRASEQQLRASEKRYRLLFEMESDAILVTDAATLQLLDANHAAVDLWGYGYDELMHLKATDLSAEEEATRSALQGEDGTIAVPMRWHRKKDGTVFPVEITLNRFELDGRKIVLSAIRDITERRQREEALAESEAQLGAGAEDGSARTSHRRHRTRFQQSADEHHGLCRCSQQDRARREPKLATYLEQAKLSCAGRAISIQQMLTFSRGQRGRPRPVALASVVQGIHEALASSLPATSRSARSSTATWRRSCSTRCSSSRCC